MPDANGAWESHRLLVAMLVLPILTFVVTYSISLSNGTMEYPYYFLSVSIESKPASCIGTFGLSATCLVAPFLAFIRYSFVRKHLEENMEKGAMFDKVKLWNRRAFYFAIFTGIGGHGVASFQSSVDDCGGEHWIVGVHLWFALMFFGGGAIYCIISYWLDLKLPNLGSPRERISRKIFCYGTIAQVFAVFCVLPGIYTWLGGEPAVIAIMSFLEVTTLGTFMSLGQGTYHPRVLYLATGFDG
ncbi:hypothetical protein TrCOL_g7777 [Triparma columacea]|uniref:CWH43-like N-terminal domain-containing protein n=1 Tax=Triparma columacea TaxID=722753 RepID=A0A9W7GGK1_9STRA|nr:hypothetical protein TrCOL_g7777 [Triparma columacea]